MMYGLQHRTILSAALQGCPLSLALAEPMAELASAGLIERAMDLDGDQRATVVLTRAGREVARRELLAAKWLLWRRLYEARRERAVKLRAEGRIEDGRRLDRLAARALLLAQRAFSAAYERCTE